MTKSAKQKATKPLGAADFRRLVRALERVATSLETVVDRKKRTLRMVDVERGKVYKTHLGGKLRRTGFVK